MIVAYLIQSTLVKTISIYQIEPDIVLIVLVYISLSDGKIMGTIFGFSAGWLQDVFAPVTLGLNSLCKSIVGFLVGYTSGGVIEENLIAQGVILFFAAMLHDVLHIFIKSWGHLHDYPLKLIREGLPDALYTTAVGLIFFAFLLIRRRGRTAYGKRFLSR